MLIAVARSSTRCMSAPSSGSVVSTAKRNPAYEPAFPISSASSADSCITSASAAASSSATLPRRVSMLAAIVSAASSAASTPSTPRPSTSGSRSHATSAAAKSAFSVVVMGPPYGASASGSPSAWTTVRVWVARVSVT